MRALETAITKTLEQGFRIKWVRSDGEPAMGTAQVARILADSTIELDIVSSGGHAHTVERRIRFIKEKYRTIENGLPYAMPRKIQHFAVHHANRMTNMQVSSNSTSNITPREKFLGRQFDYKKDGGVPFGSYVQATRPNTDNSSASRIDGCIALCPKDSVSGSRYVYKLQTGTIVTRTHMKVIPMTQLIIDHLDGIAAEDGIFKDDDPELDIDDYLHTEEDDDDTPTIATTPVRQSDRKPLVPALIGGATQQQQTYDVDEQDDQDEDPMFLKSPTVW